MGIERQQRFEEIVKAESSKQVQCLQLGSPQQFNACTLIGMMVAGSLSQQTLKNELEVGFLGTLIHRIHHTAETKYAEDLQQNERLVAGYTVREAAQILPHITRTQGVTVSEPTSLKTGASQNVITEFINDAKIAFNEEDVMFQQQLIIGLSEKAASLFDETLYNRVFDGLCDREFTVELIEAMYAKADEPGTVDNPFVAMLHDSHAYLMMHNGHTIVLGKSADNVFYSYDSQTGRLDYSEQLEPFAAHLFARFMSSEGGMEYTQVSFESSVLQHNVAATVSNASTAKVSNPAEGSRVEALTVELERLMIEKSALLEKIESITDDPLLEEAMQVFVMLNQSIEQLEYDLAMARSLGETGAHTTPPMESRANASEQLSGDGSASVRRQKKMSAPYQKTERKCQKFIEHLTDEIKSTSWYTGLGGEFLNTNKTKKVPKHVKAIWIICQDKNKNNRQKVSAIQGCLEDTKNTSHSGFMKFIRRLFTVFGLPVRAENTQRFYDTTRTSSKQLNEDSRTMKSSM